MMWAFMTTGTASFLKQMAEKHETKDFFFMKKAATTLVYYEGDRKKSIFVSGRAYEVIHAFGELRKTGFVLMNHMPVSEEEIPVFEERIKKQLSSVRQQSGLYAARLLRELKSNQYVIMMQWKTEKEFEGWEEQDDHALAFSKNAKLPAYFLDRPFTNRYYMLKDEDDQ